MDDARLKSWETLFGRALVLLDSAAEMGASVEGWSFGGGTVLMRRYRHRFSKDIDIFVSDPQLLGYLSPRLNVRAESLTEHYVEQGNFVKLFFDEGEIDFVASGPLTENPFESEKILERDILVETTAEIVAKKIWHRGDEFKARGIFDLALVAEKAGQTLQAIAPVLRDRRDAVMRRIESHDVELRDAFAALEVLDYTRTYDECLTIVREAFNACRPEE